MVEEVIYISSEDAEDDSGAWDERGVIRSLEQEHPHVAGHQRLSVVEGNLIRVEQRRGKAWARFYVQPGFLDPTPERETHVPTWQIGVAGAAVVLAAMLIWQDGLGLVHSALQLAGVLTAVGLVGAGAAWLALRGYGRSIVFRTRHGRAPVIRMAESAPDATQCRQFLKALRTAVDRARSRLPGDRERFLVEELKEHRRLAETGGLDPAAYEAAKARILRSH